MIRAAIALVFAAPLLAGCATTDGHQYATNLPDAAPYDERADARLDLELALAMAAAESAVLEDERAVLVLAVFGANWCHDSRALAGWLETPRFRALTDEHYHVVYIDAGVPQTGEGRNLDLAAEYGVDDVTGTPSVLFLDGGGELLNTPEDARSWRNAASRSEDAIYAALESYIQPQS